MKNLFFIFCYLFINALNASNNVKVIKAKEVLLNKTSFVFSNNKDSLLEKSYKLVYKNLNNQNYVVALNNGLQLYDDSKKNGSSYWLIKSSLLLADIYSKTNRYKKALKLYKESLKLVESNLDKKNTANANSLNYAKSLINIGGNYQKLSNSTIENDKLFYLDSAKIYYNKVIELPNFNKDIDMIKAKAFNNLSGIYEMDSIYDKAEIYVNKAIGIHEKYVNNISKASALNNLGNIFLSQKKFNKSKEIYIEAIDLLKFDNNSKASKIKSSLYFNLAWAMRNLEEIEAYDFQEKFYEIEENEREKEFKGIIEEINAKYDVDVAKKIVRQEEENKRLKTQRAFSIFGIIGLIVILSLGYWLVINNLRQKNLALNLSQTKLIQNQKIEKIKSEAQVRILNATIDGKESERKQIAETLHDNVSALLSSANLHLQATKKQFNGSTPVEIDKTREIILEASKKIRDLSHTLVSSVLLKFGLTFAIKEIAEKYSNSEINIETEINNVERYHQNFEIKVYNIIQEFVNNILKHSKADNALIELEQKEDKLFIIISDDGVGFDKTKITSKDGLGLNQIDARIQMMKGKFKIESSKNNGTQISVELPVLEKEEPSLV